MTYKKSENSAIEHVKILSFDSNPNLGLYGFATDEYCLIGEEIHDKHKLEIERILKVPVHSITIAGTSLIGAFVSGNSNCLLVPEITYDYEMKKLEELKINFKMIKTHLTALGNNITANNSGAVINPEFSKQAEKDIKEALKVNIQKSKIAGFENVGSCLIINNNGGLIHRDAEEFEITILEKLFNLEILEGSINMGNPYVKSGIIANSHGLIVGNLSGGPEINNADDALGFLNNK